MIEGAVEGRVAESVISGKFDLMSQPFGVADTSVRASVRGRFEIEYEPYRE